jgi:quercetin dioxygenase-like cupin family protein
MRIKPLVSGAAIALAFNAGILVSSLVSAQSSGIPGLVMRHDLRGLEGQEVIMQSVTLAPGGGIPWHQHPDGQEISYVLEGTGKLEIEGEGMREVKAGEGFYIPPGVVHRAFNDSGAPVKVLVVRVNAKGKPIMVPVQK